jgi:hypothetical protein
LAHSTRLRSAFLSINRTFARGGCGGLVPKDDVAFVGSELVNMAIHLLVKRGYTAYSLTANSEK